MRVAFFVSEFPSLPAPYLAYQMSGLIQRGHHVEIFAARQGNTEVIQPEVQNFDLLKKTRYFPRMPGNSVARIARAGSLLLRHRGSRTLLRSLNFVRYGKDARTLRLLASATTCLQSTRNFDVIHCNFGPNGNLAAQLRDAGAISGKLITTFHRYDIALGFDQGHGVYAALHQYGDGFVAISQDNRKQLTTLGFPESKIYDLHVGIPLKKFSYREPRCPQAGDPIRILTTARLVPVKGLEYGLEAIHLLLKRYPQLNLRYTVIGEGELDKPLKKLTSRLGLNEIVHFAGALSASELLEAMRDSDIFMLPSLAEGLPAVLMEAMAIGLPVVATDVSAVSELVLNGETGFVVPPGNAQVLERSLALLVQTPKLWKDMAQRGRTRVEQRHDADKLTDDLIRIYQGLITKSPL